MMMNEIRNANGSIDREEMAADRRRVAGGTIWRDLVLANDSDGKEAIDELLDLMPELDSREQQLIVKRVIKKLNGLLNRNTRLGNFRDLYGSD